MAAALLGEMWGPKVQRGTHRGQEQVCWGELTMDMNESVQRRTHNGQEQQCAGENTEWTGTSAGWGLKVDHGAVTPGKAGG